MAATAPVLPAPPLAERLRRIIRRAQPSAYLFLLPALLFCATFRLYPYAQTFWYGLHDWNGMTPPRWVGLGNVEAAQDPYFWRAGYQTLAFMAIDITHPADRGADAGYHGFRGHARSDLLPRGFFTPYVLSAAVVSVMWKQIAPNIGIVNSALRAVGLGQFAHPGWAIRSTPCRPWRWRTPGTATASRSWCSWRRSRASTRRSTRRPGSTAPTGSWCAT